MHDRAALDGQEIFIAVQSLLTETADISTSNGRIEGDFCCTNSLELRTTNAPIDTSVTLTSTDPGRSARLEMTTTHRCVRDNAELIDANAITMRLLALSDRRSALSLLYRAEPGPHSRSLPKRLTGRLTSTSRMHPSIQSYNSRVPPKKARLT